MTNATEVAKLRRSEAPDVQLMLDIAERQYPTSIRKRAIQKLLEEMKQAYLNQLKGLASRRESMDSDAIRKEAVAIMTTTFMLAARLGLEVVGLSGWELNDRQLDAFVKIVESESDYFVNWMQDLKANESMGFEQRLGLYGGGVEESFWTGWTQGLPSISMIDWRLSVAEHCIGCLDLSARSPYTKPGYGDNPLPTVPRAGATPCLRQCKCYLEARIGQYVRNSLFNRPGVEVTSFGENVLDPNSEQALIAAQYYQKYAERYVWHKRMDALNPSAGHELAAKSIVATMQELAERLGHGVRLTMTVAEILGPIDIAKSAGFRFIRPTALAEELIGLTALMILIDGTDRGTVTEFGTNPPTVEIENDPRRIYRVDENGGAILFIER